MNFRKKTTLWLAILAIAPVFGQTLKEWTLDDCIKYAIENNISLKQKKIAHEESVIDTKTAKANLFPSLSFSTNQNLTNRPYSETTTNLTSGSMTVSNHKTTYNGNYGLNANWTVFNGGKNTKNVKLQKVTEQINSLSIDETSNSIIEQIAKLYVLILYSSEAVEVDRKMLTTATANYERGKAMFKGGLLSKSELTQLEAQESQTRYTVVSAETTVENYKLQLKQLLELDGNETFEVSKNEATEQMALATIPSREQVYNAAIQTRPEIQSSKLSVENADLNISIAKGGYMPTVSITAGIGSSNSSGQKGSSFSDQIRRNLNNSFGINMQIPIYNNRSTKSSVEKAKLQRVNAALSLQSEEKKLYSNVATLWLDANSAQRKYIAAKENSKSTQASFDLINEQFNVGLKNISDLNKSKDELIQAKQNELESKYTSILNIELLKFYAGEDIYNISK